MARNNFQDRLEVPLAGSRIAEKRQVHCDANRRKHARLLSGRFGSESEAATAVWCKSLPDSILSACGERNSGLSSEPGCNRPTNAEADAGSIPAALAFL